MPDPVQLCVLCSRRTATTREHVPAAGLFPSPKPSNLITVPACELCNEGTGSDDEYLRSYFAMRAEPRQTSSLDAIRATVGRSFVRPQFRGLQENFARGIRFAWVPEPSGQVLTFQSLMVPDMERVLGVVAKNARGLFFHLTGRILPPETKLLVFPDHKADELPPAQQRVVKRWVRASISGVKGHLGEVFGYALRTTDDNPDAFAAGLIYFKAFSFLVVTARSEVQTRMIVLPPIRA